MMLEIIDTEAPTGVPHTSSMEMVGLIGALRRYICSYDSINGENDAIAWSKKCILRAERLRPDTIFPMLCIVFLISDVIAPCACFGECILPLRHFKIGLVQQMR